MSCSQPLHTNCRFTGCVRKASERAQACPACTARRCLWDPLLPCCLVDTYCLLSRSTASVFIALPRPNASQLHLFDSVPLLLPAVLPNLFNCHPAPPSPKPLLCRQRVCRCVYGNAAILASRSEAEPAPDAAEAYMRRARAAWRLLHHPDSPALRDSEPVVLWLPRLEKRAAQPAASAALAAAAAQVQRTEAAARAAVVHAAGLAAAAGLPFRLPDQLQAQLGGVPLDLGGLVQVGAQGGKQPRVGGGERGRRWGEEHAGRGACESEDGRQGGKAC